MDCFEERSKQITNLLIGLRRAKATGGEKVGRAAAVCIGFNLVTCTVTAIWLPPGTVPEAVLQRTVAAESSLSFVVIHSSVHHFFFLFFSNSVKTHCDIGY